MDVERFVFEDFAAAEVEGLVTSTIDEGLAYANLHFLPPGLLSRLSSHPPPSMMPGSGTSAIRLLTTAIV